MAKYYQFKAPVGDTRVVTDNRSASKVPDHATGSPWLLEKELELKAGDKKDDEIIAAVTKSGYYKCA